MINKLKKIKIVGEFIKRKRIEHNLSQKELGSLLQPIVTTQFISNIERGITPLPLSHIPALAKNLNIIESEILSLLEKEYVLKLSGKLNQMGSSTLGETKESLEIQYLCISNRDYDFMKKLYDRIKSSDETTYQNFVSTCEQLFTSRPHA